MKTEIQFIAGIRIKKNALVYIRDGKAFPVEQAKRSKAKARKSRSK
jgi:hypothetical protein